MACGDLDYASQLCEAILCFIYVFICQLSFLHFKTSPYLLPMFTTMQQRCFAVELFLLFSPVFLSAPGGGELFVKHVPT